jgi:hypothetical protein
MKKKDIHKVWERLKTAKLPLNHNLENFDHSVDNGMNKTHLNQFFEKD